MVTDMFLWESKMLEKHTRALVAGLLLGTVLLAGCSSSQNVASKSNELAELAVVDGQMPSDASKDKMLAAKDALFTRLSGRLMQVMRKQGPAAAIAVCQKEAAEIAKSVSQEHGLQIGRTGVRLRNQTNVAPDWAAALVSQRTDATTFAVLDNGEAAALLPIKLGAKCLMCHGPKDQLPSVVKDELSRLYPEDRATGFAEGELRGWFWVQLKP